MPTNILVLNKSWLVTGAGDPEGTQEGPKGSVFLREDGATGTSFYIKESGSGNTGWRAFAKLVPLHHSTHDTGGMDAITSVSAVILTSGIVPDARLASNIPRLNLANVFTDDQFISKPGASLRMLDLNGAVNQKLWVMGCDQAPDFYFQARDDAGNITANAAIFRRTGDVEVGRNLSAGGTGGNVARKDIDNGFVPQSLASGSNLTGANSLLYLQDTTAPVGYKCWRILQMGDGHLRFECLTDGFGAVQYTPLLLSRQGDIWVGGNVYEKNRTTPMGHWLPVPFSPTNFAASGGMAFTVTAGNISANRYTVIGKTLIWNLYVSNAVLSGTSDIALYLYPPAGFTYPGITQIMGMINVGGGWGAALVASNGGYLTVYRQDIAPMTLGPVYVSFEITLEIA